MATVCAHCMGSLMGKRYITQNQSPTCLTCYDVKFANQCVKCRKAIGTQSKDVTYKDEHYHDGCFICSSCKTPLSNSQFLNHGGSLVCDPCYNSKYAESCDKCHKIFKHGMEKVDYDSKKYHTECFTCLQCRKPIGTSKFMQKNGEMWCMNCYNESHGSKCGACTKIIHRCGLKHDGLLYHKECFVCTSCKSMLSGVKYATKDGKPYCVECHARSFARKCHLCVKPISGLGMSTKFVSFEGKHWHSQCFRCSVCTKNLAGEGFLQRSSKILCAKCGY